MSNITAKGFYNFITAFEEIMADRGEEYLNREVKVELNKWLTQDGGNINDVIDQSGNTLLHSALLKGRFRLVQALLESKADTNLPNHNGQTALEIGKTKKLFIDLFSALPKESVRSSSSSSSSSSPTTFDYNRMKWMNAEALDTYILGLKKAGVDINGYNDRGMTILLDVCYYCNTEVATALVQHGADVNLKSKKGNASCINFALMGAKDKEGEDALGILKLMTESGFNGWEDKISFNVTPDVKGGANFQFPYADCLPR